MLKRKIYNFCEDKKGFAKKLTELMKENKITTSMLEDELGDGYSCNLINSWRSGKRTPDLDMIHKLSKKFGISMQELYMPNSIYIPEVENKFPSIIFSDDFPSEMFVEKLYPEYLDNGVILSRQLDFDMFLSLKEAVFYTDYLLQKMLFSYLKHKEKNILQKALEKFYIFSDYGKEELEMKTEKINYESFSAKMDNLLVQKYGRSYKFKMDEFKSKEILFEVYKIIIFAPLDNIPLLQFSIDVLLASNTTDYLIDIYPFLFNSIELNMIYTTIIEAHMEFPYLQSVLEELGAKYISNSIDFDNERDYMNKLIKEIELLSYAEYEARLKEVKKNV